MDSFAFKKGNILRGYKEEVPQFEQFAPSPKFKGKGELKCLLLKTYLIPIISLSRWEVFLEKVNVIFFPNITCIRPNVQDSHLQLGLEEVADMKSPPMPLGKGRAKILVQWDQNHKIIYNYGIIGIIFFNRIKIILIVYFLF